MKTKFRSQKKKIPLLILLFFALSCFTGGNAAAEDDDPALETQQVSFGVVFISTLLFLALIVVLSLRIRKGEMETMFKLGCNRGTIAMLQLGELAFIFAIAGVLLAAAVGVVWQYSGDLVQALLLGS